MSTGSDARDIRFAMSMATCISLGVLLAGCSSSSNPSSPTPPAGPDGSMSPEEPDEPSGDAEWATLVSMPTNSDAVRFDTTAMQAELLTLVGERNADSLSKQAAATRLGLPVRDAAL